MTQFYSGDLNLVATWHSVVGQYFLDRLTLHFCDVAQFERRGAFFFIRRFSWQWGIENWFEPGSLLTAGWRLLTQLHTLNWFQHYSRVLPLWTGWQGLTGNGSDILGWESRASLCGTLDPGKLKDLVLQAGPLRLRLSGRTYRLIKDLTRTNS